MRSLLLCALAASVAGRMEVKENGQKVFYAETDDKCVVVTDEGVIDISRLPTTSLDMGQENYGQLVIYTWVVSWCRQETLLPSGGGAAPCLMQPSYAAEYAPTYCDHSCTAWDAPLHATKVNGVWRVGYTVTQPAEGWVRRRDTNVMIECGTPNAGEAVSCVKAWGDSVCMVKQVASDFSTFFLRYRTNLVCPSFPVKCDTLVYSRGTCPPGSSIVDLSTLVKCKDFLCQSRMGPFSYAHGTDKTKLLSGQGLGCEMKEWDGEGQNGIICQTEQT